MNYIKRAIKFLPKKKEHNFLKIFSLSIGLAASLVMLAKVRFENSYDNFFPDKEFIYQIQCEYQKDGKIDDIGTRIPGGVAIGAKAENSRVASSTRFVRIEGSVFSTEKKNSYHANFVLADSAFFSVFSRKIIMGDPLKILSSPMQVMITDEIAERIGGDPIGQIIEIDAYPNVKLTIAGIYEKIPENSHLGWLDVLVSMPSISQFMRDNSMNWDGGDRYLSYVKLFDVSSVKQVENDINSMIERNVDMEEEWRKYGEDLRYYITPLSELHSKRKSIETMAWILLLLSSVILFAAVMNYVLIVISSIVARSKEIALHKCYGASNIKIHMMMLSESFVHIVISLSLSVMLISFFRGGIEQLLGRSVDTLFQFSNCWPLIAVCMAIWLFAGLLPGILFSRIPVSTVFRVFSDNKQRWKMSLLFIQSVTAGFLVSFLWIVSIQYNFMMNGNVGYNYENVLYVSMSNVEKSKQEMCANEMLKLPQVAEVSTCSWLPIWGPGGNTAYFNEESMINYVNLSFVGDNHVDFMQIPLLEGSGFQLKNGTEAMVSRSFVERMNSFGKWPNGVIGESFEAGESRIITTICGVFEDFKIGNAIYEDNRPVVMYCDDEISLNYMLIKLKNLSPETIQEVNDKFKELLPDKSPVANSWKTAVEWLYRNELNFRNSVLVGSLIALIITILGLIGYLNNEINRRSKEIAIRKISGATKQDIILLFIRQISLLSIGAFAIGAIGAMIVAGSWQEQFALKAPLPWYLYVGCVAVLTLLVYAIVTVNCLRIAKQNPIEGLSK